MMWWRIKTSFSIRTTWIRVECFHDLCFHHLNIWLINIIRFLILLHIVLSKWYWFWFCGLYSRSPRSRPAWCRTRPAGRRRSCLRWGWRWRRRSSSPRSDWWPWCRAWLLRKHRGHDANMSNTVRDATPVRKQEPLVHQTVSERRRDRHVKLRAHDSGRTTDLHWTDMF